MRRAAAAFDHYTKALLRKDFTADQLGVVRGPVEALADAPEEISLRTLATIVRAAGGGEHFPPLESIEGLRKAVLDAGENDSVRRTLHGAVVKVEGGRLKAQREWGRTGIPELDASPKTTVVWDGRFRVEVPGLSGRLQIGPLGRSAVKLRAEDADWEAVRCAPGLFFEGALVALPAGIVPTDGEARGLLATECLVSQRLTSENLEDGRSAPP
jgi:tRNA(Ile)-lysidine synthase